VSDRPASELLEIEIAPEMVREGASAHADYGPDDNSKAAAVAVFESMLEASDKNIKVIRSFRPNSYD
jgi:hypothetical protein